MINQPRFRKGKKFAKATHRTPKQEKMYRRYMAALTLFRIKRHAQIQAAMRIMFSAGASAMTSIHIAKLQSVMCTTPQQKAIAIAKGLIGGYQSISKAFEYKLPQPA